MKIEKDGDALLVPGRIDSDGGVFEGTQRLLPGDEGYDRWLAVYETGRLISPEDDEWFGALVGLR